MQCMSAKMEAATARAHQPGPSAAVRKRLRRRAAAASPGKHGVTRDGTKGSDFSFSFFFKKALTEVLHCFHLRILGAERMLKHELALV